MIQAILLKDRHLMCYILRTYFNGFIQFTLLCERHSVKLFHCNDSMTTDPK